VRVKIGGHVSNCLSFGFSFSLSPYSLTLIGLDGIIQFRGKDKVKL
jgi:hypothetical protein